MRALVIATIAFAISGCAKKATPPAVESGALVPTREQAAQAQAERQNPRMKNAAVYVDGKIVAFLKVHELPLGLEPLQTHRRQLEYGFVPYLRAIGVDVDKVRALHMHGGRTSILSGAALRKGGNAVRFAFDADGRGKPRPAFDGSVKKSLGLNTSIDLIGAVAVYVDKEPPHENEAFELAYPDGTLVSGMAYADPEASAGTRVYLDGKLVSIVKRKALTTELLASGDLSKPEYSLEAYLRAAGVDPEKANTVDFIANDSPVGHFEAAALKGMTFTVPPRNQGLAVFDLPQWSQQKITAIQLYANVSAPARQPAPPKPVDGKTQKG